MSYGSTFDQFDPNGKISSRLSRSHYRRNESERPHKLIHYDKEFDVSLSRVTETGSVSDRSSVQSSMLAYSNKMKSIRDAQRTTGGNKSDPLFVKAKHIPKHPVRTPKKRRPMSFDELLGRDRDAPRGNGGKPRPHSDRQKPTRGDKEDETQLPVLKERLRNSGYNVQVSLVSASDLYDLVDFSLRSKHSKAENIQMRNMETRENTVPQRRRNKVSDRFLTDSAPKNDYDKFQRTREPLKASVRDIPGDNLVPSTSYYESVFSLDKLGDITFPVESSKGSAKLPAVGSEILKRRPHRSKRMKLLDSQTLHDIPEDTIIDSGGEIKSSAQIEISRRVISPPPHRRSPKSQDLISKSPLDAILEQNEKYNGNNNNNNVPATVNEMTEVTYEDNTRRRGGEHTLYTSVLPNIDETKTTKKMLIRDDGDVRIEVTQCPPKNEPANTKLRAQKRIKKLIFLRDGPR